MYCSTTPCDGYFKKSLNQEEPVYVIYMDLQKAFDTDPQKHLLYKIEYYGIAPQMDYWISI